MSPARPCPLVWSLPVPLNPVRLLFRGETASPRVGAVTLGHQQHSVNENTVLLSQPGAYIPTPAASRQDAKLCVFSVNKGVCGEIGRK